MATQGQVTDQTAVNIVSTLNLQEGSSYKIDVNGPGPVSIGFGATAPLKSHPLFPSSARSQHSNFVKVVSGEGIWVQSQRDNEIVVTEVD